MELTTPLTFYDPQELAWDVPKGAIVDGAPIPRMFWLSVPSPAEDLDDTALRQTAEEFEAPVSRSDISLEEIEQLAEESAPALR